MNKLIVIAVALSFIGLMCGAGALYYSLKVTDTGTGVVSFKMQLEKTHDTGAWVKIIEAENVKFSLIETSHDFSRTWAEGHENISKGEMWFVESPCETSNLFTVAFRNGIDTIVFETEKCNPLSVLQ